MAKVAVIFGRNGLQDIQVNDEYLDLDAIREKPIDEWFEESDGRDGWEGLLNEIYDKIGDHQANLTWEIWGSEDLRKQVETCLKKHNAFTPSQAEESIEDRQESLWKEAEKYDHRGQYELAFKSYKNLADNYHLAEAQCKVGEYYYNNDTGTNGSKEDAFLYYEKAAEQGNTEAEFWTGRCYYFGEGVEKNVKESIKWYQKAAAKNHPRAQNGLACCYYEGEGVEEDLQKAAELWRKSAEQGYEVAQFNLANCYYNGEGVEQNIQKAIELWSKSAEQGCAGAQFALAACYSNGEGVEKNLQKAIELWSKSAEQGHAGAQNNLANRYYKGEGVEQNLQKAIELWTKSAEQGNKKAQNRLEKLKEQEENSNEDIDDPSKLMELGEKYEEEENYEKALEMYQNAAKRGVLDAKRKIGEFYIEGKGIKQDKKYAVQLLEELSKNGDSVASKILANFYLGVYGGTTNHRLYKKYNSLSMKQFRKMVGKI